MAERENRSPVGTPRRTGWRSVRSGVVVSTPCSVSEFLASFDLAVDEPRGRVRADEEQVPEHEADELSGADPPRKRSREYRQRDGEHDEREHSGEGIHAEIRGETVAHASVNGAD